MRDQRRVYRMLDESVYCYGQNSQWNYSHRRSVTGGHGELGWLSRLLDHLGRLLGRVVGRKRCKVFCKLDISVFRLWEGSLFLSASEAIVLSAWRECGRQGCEVRAQSLGDVELYLRCEAHHSKRKHSRYSSHLLSRMCSSAEIK